MSASKKSPAKGKKNMVKKVTAAKKVKKVPSSTKRLTDAQLEKILAKEMRSFEANIPQSKFTINNKNQNIQTLLRRHQRSQGFFKSGSLGIASNLWSRLSDFKFNAKFPSLRIAGPVAAMALVAIVVVYNIQEKGNEELAMTHVPTGETQQSNGLANEKKTGPVNDKAKPAVAKNSIDHYLNGKEKEILANKKARADFFKMKKEEKVMSLPNEKKKDLDDEADKVSDKIADREERSDKMFRAESSNIENKDIYKKKQTYFQKLKADSGNEKLYLEIKKFLNENKDNEGLKELEKIYSPDQKR